MSNASKLKRARHGAPKTMDFRPGETVVFLYGVKGVIKESADHGRFLVERADGVKGVFSPSQFKRAA